MVLRSSLTTVLCAVLAGAWARADDWPMFRADPLRSGTSAEELPAQLRRAWTFTAPHPPAPAWPRRQRLTFDRVFQPVVAGGLACFGSSSDDRIYALDAASGKLRWAFCTGGPVRFAPVLWRGLVFATSDDGFLYCLRAGDGELLWRRRGGPDGQLVLGNGRAISRWPARGGAVVRDGIVYFAAGIWPSDGIYLRALDARSGEQLWLEEDAGSIYMPQPHGGAEAESGVSAQGYLVATEDLLLVPTGRSVPAAFERQSGVLRYFHLQANGQRGGSATMASGKFFFNSGVFFDAKSGTAQGRTGALAIAGIAGGLVAATREGVELFRWLEQSGTAGARKRSLHKVFQAGADGACNGVIVAGTSAFVGGEGLVERIDLQAQRASWKARVEGAVHGLAAAGGRLFVSTDRGRLIAFDGVGGALVEGGASAAHTPVAGGDEEAAVRAARAILARSSVRAGICVDLGCGDGALSCALARLSDLRVIAVDPDPAMVARARRRFAAAGLSGARASALQAPLETTLLPRCMANLVVSARALEDAPGAPEVAEMKRLQRPHGGVLCLGAPGALRVSTRGAPPGEGTWTHQYADPANTSCSGDTIAGRLGMDWFAEIDQPMPSRHGRAPAPLYLGGRIFSLGLDSLIAVDAYNGTALWKVALPGILRAYDGDHLMGTAGTNSPYCATPAGIYVRQGSRCLRFDPASGARLGEFPAPPGADGKPRPWGYIACAQGLLFGTLANPAHVVTYRYLEGGDLAQQLTESTALFALDARTGELRWRYRARHSIRHNAIAIGGGSVFLIDRELALFDRKREAKPGVQPGGVLVALDARTGRPRWRSEKEIFGTMLALSVSKRALLMSYQPTRFRLASEIGGRMAVFDTARGKRRWDQRVRYDSRPLINGATIYAQGGAWDLLSGAPRPFPFKRSYGCGILASGAKMLVYRSATLGYFDFERDRGTENFGGMRPGCWINALPAGGLVLVPDATSGCVCSYQNRAWVALQSEDLRPPMAAPAGGGFRAPVRVELRAAERGAEVRYTLDGSSPSATSPRYHRPIRIEASAKLKARSFRAGARPSLLASFDYVIDAALLPLENNAWQVWDSAAKGVASAPSAWRVSSGSVLQSSNIFLPPAAGAPAYTLPYDGTLRIYRAGVHLRDGELSLQIRSADNDGMGVAFRLRDARHHYLFHWDQERKLRVLARRDGERYTVLAHDAVPYRSGRWYDLAVRLAGARITIRIDAQPIFDLRDDTYREGTIALHSWGSQGVEFRAIRFRRD